ncbi:hypothetical protein [Microbulbifer sp. SSSA005]|uniref:hypothetical protein n=1 Tax=Microbulbifer sp. SSSA005 TaxID=3243378 RepID=UPI0040392BA2
MIVGVVASAGLFGTGAGTGGVVLTSRPYAIEAADQLAISGHVQGLRQRPVTESLSLVPLVASITIHQLKPPHNTSVEPEALTMSASIDRIQITQLRDLYRQYEYEPEALMFSVSVPFIRVKDAAIPYSSEAESLGIFANINSIQITVS